MPVLFLQSEDKSAYILRDLRDDDQVTVYDLRPEGAQILLNVYGLKVGGAVAADTVEKMLGLQLASLRPPVVVAEVKPAPVVEKPPVAATAPSLPTTPKPVMGGKGPLSRASRETERPSDSASRPLPSKAGMAPSEARGVGATQRQQRRTRGREVALQVLYQVEQNPGLPQGEVDRFLQRRLQEPKLCEFAKALVTGVKGNQEKIDTLITDVAENWRLDRMAAIDRNILRIGAYEMLFDQGVPAKVAINEALELAKRYSTAQSSRFVNGILDRLLSADSAKSSKVEPESASSETPTPAAEA